MEDVLLNCLTIGSAFSACGGWGHLVNKAPLVLLSVSKCPCSASNCCSIPHLPADNVPPTGASDKTPGNQPSSSGSRRCPSE
ncbi:hypothetical protein DSO57_1002498 [Entomophthora muscae]|uniref:Uncharacterized protein n=1 Tax=Entomophthora muscae TaxID=34485 RepID=A0ACC2SLG0_9FUNG|nr:hypothetical protein DSO57_1002498 [Entomophthora muscae]